MRAPHPPLPSMPTLRAPPPLRPCVHTPCVHTPLPSMPTLPAPPPFTHRCACLSLERAPWPHKPGPPTQAQPTIPQTSRSKHAGMHPHMQAHAQTCRRRPSHTGPQLQALTFPHLQALTFTHRPTLAGVDLHTQARAHIARRTTAHMQACTHACRQANTCAGAHPRTHTCRHAHACRRAHAEART